jgi:uridine kinase
VCGDCPYEERLRRGIERDGEAIGAMWVEHWMPVEDRYVEAERPDTRVDLALDESGSAGNAVLFRVLTP